MDILTDDSELLINILDFSIENEIRLDLFNQFCSLKDLNSSLELLNRIIGMYNFSGSKIIEQFLFTLCEIESIPIELRLESSQSLLLFSELEEPILKTDSEESIKIKDENNTQIKERNSIREELGYKAIDIVCNKFSNSELSIPCKIKAIFSLMKNSKYDTNSDLYFRHIINNNNIDSDYRYKCILSLENNVLNYKFFIQNACLDFLKNKYIRTMYRILSGQYLLQHCELNSEDKIIIQDILYSFATDEELDYNLRADAADTLLGLGTDEYKENARNIIICLGRIGGNNKTIYDNAQNVHTTEIEKSVSNIIGLLCSSNIPLKVDGTEIDFEHVENEIINILNEEPYKISCNLQKCDINNFTQKEIYEIKKNIFCKKCIKNVEKKDKITISLNRIKMDRTLYLNTYKLNNILIKIWTRINTTDYNSLYKSDISIKNELIKRLLEELEEMSGTCTSGFITRLANIFSGFDEDLTVRISIEDQIIANFTGRLNQYAQKILEPDSLFYSSKLQDVLELYINSNNDIKKNLILSITKSKIITDLPPVKIIINKFLETDKDLKIQQCIQSFYDNVLDEMMLDAHKYHERLHFCLFFRTYLPMIREELYKEFEEYISPTLFDLCIRKSISTYEGLDILL